MSELKVDGINLGGYLPRGRPPNVYQFTHPNVFRVFTFSRGLGYAKYPLFVPSHRAIEVDEEMQLLHQVDAMVTQLPILLHSSL